MSDKRGGTPPEYINPWNVLACLGSVEAVKKYNEYLKEHRRRLKQLEREANGEMSPSEESYRS